MDPFAVIMLGGVAGLALALYLLGRTYPGSGADVLDWKPTRSAETEMENELSEMEAMLAVANRRRVRRGQEPLDEDGFRAMIMAEQAEHSRQHDEQHLDEEFDQMVEVKNRKRRAKGLPELTVDEYRAQIEKDVGA